MSANTMHVAVLIETDDSWGRNVVESIARYAHAAEWTLLIAPRDQQRRLRLPRGWVGDGILVSLRDKSMASHIRRFAVPTVDVSIMLPTETWLGRVATDDHARAKLAFEHFHDRGLQNFSCYAPSIGRYSHERAEQFRNAVNEAGLKCWPSPPKSVSDWQANYRIAIEWLKSLPRPLGVFASDPHPARQLAEICQLAEVRIPDDLALISGDNDELLCNVAWPPISSVELASHRIGQEACEMLSWMRRTGRVPSAPKLISPLQIISRHSTEILAMANEEIADILRFIRTHAKGGIQVVDVLKAFPISRRSLEMRFRELLGRSPAEEIRRVRLEHARSLVLETELTIASIANRCGFSDGASLSHAFRKHFEMTPGELRSSRHSARAADNR